MAAEHRRLRDRAARCRLITASARALAEREGWDAVTTRRLSTEIEYSQPVIYKHFASMEDLVEAIALEGFGELAETLGESRRDAAPEEAVGAVARAYSTYATENPALYDAMFTRATRLRFGAEDTASPLSAAYAELRAAVATIADGRDIDTLTEVLWAALHGLTTLGRSDRIRPGHHTDRMGDTQRAQVVAAPQGGLVRGERRALHPEPGSSAADRAAVRDAIAAQIVTMARVYRRKIVCAAGCGWGVGSEPRSPAGHGRIGREDQSPRIGLPARAPETPPNATGQKDAVGLRTGRPPPDHAEAIPRRPPLRLANRLARAREAPDPPVRGPLTCRATTTAWPWPTVRARPGTFRATPPWCPDSSASAR